MKSTATILSLLLISASIYAQDPVVKYQGRMSKIGQEKRIDAEMLVDTIHAKHLYALGPVENLRGEIIIWDSKPFVAALTTEGEPFLLKNVKNLRAIFLVYADIAQWDTITISERPNSLDDLQKNITKEANRHGTDTNTAFPFILLGKVKKGSGHIMFMDTTVKTVTAESLKEATHINTFKDQNAQMLGFYSQHHQTIFTHHDSYLHIHYRLGNKYQAGHLNEVVFDKSEPLKLLLPHK